MTRDLNHQALAQRHLNRALTAIDADMPQFALDQLATVLKIEPGNLTARLAQARAELAANRPHLALVALDAADLYHPERRQSPQFTLLRVQALLRAQRHALAEPQLLRLAHELPDDVRSRRLLAELYLQRGADEKAAEQLRHVMRLSPSDRAAARILAQLTGASNPQSGIELLEAATATKPDAVDDLEIARLCRQSQRLCEAESVYARLLAQRPDDAVVCREAGELADAMGADALASARLEHVLQIKPDDVDAALLLAQVHLHAGRFAAAGRLYWRAARHDSGRIDAWAGLLIAGVCSQRPNVVRRAQQQLDRTTGKNERRMCLARLWQHAATGQVIRQTGAKAMTNQDEAPLQRFLHHAAETLETHLREHEHRADAHYHLAACRQALGQTKPATEHVRRALAINPRYEAAKKLAARIEACGGLRAAG